MQRQNEIRSLVKQGAIAVVDFGGQYAHLIASRIRRLGAYSEILQAEDLSLGLDSFFKGVIFSGGPSSVYDKEAVSSNLSFSLDKLQIPVLGICYGHQFIVHQMGGQVHRGKRQEYGPAKLKIFESVPLFKNVADESTVWMSHGDEVVSLPTGFKKIGSTESCEYTAIFNSKLNIYSVQFHPEVSHTVFGEQILTNFIELCNLKDSWKIQDFAEIEQKRIQESLQNKKVFFLVSGGVDSTVAYALLGKEMNPNDLTGMLVDTGFLRQNEAIKVKESLLGIGVDLRIHNAEDQFISALAEVYEPEKKRKIIGDLFLDVQKQVSNELGLTESEWLLGQGTIYPDTIESGATKSSQTIKTHHNRVGRVQELIEQGLVIEPLKDLYKDEVRALGRHIGLPESLVDRHPFPGPGLAVRCLCTGDTDTGLAEPFTELKDVLSIVGLFQASILPVRSVGVQGDQRSYSHPLSLYSQKSISELVFTEKSWFDLIDTAAKIIGQLSRINRVVYRVGSLAQGQAIEALVKNRYITKERMSVLRVADAIVNDFLVEKDIYNEIWQMPVVLLPIQNSNEPNSNRESIVLRPILSTDAMTATAYPMKASLLTELVNRLLKTNYFDFIYYDITSKPPGTIEWE
ncbi:MAG: glutamine-hydrolyzing GMP synthase [Leptonema sp. (in: Bacteria)]|nr:glutamine-hydrolyzing GMP synthase [Leptonema sp. (in: bacteria)]